MCIRDRRGPQLAQLSQCCRPCNATCTAVLRIISKRFRAVACMRRVGGCRPPGLSPVGSVA
eukprot:4907341-Alexandrium_andersonii.AAC.1